MADAMWRFGYPSCKTFQDESQHGSAAARAVVKQIIQEEVLEGRTVGLISWEIYPTGSVRTWENVLLVESTIEQWAELPPSWVSVITRSGRNSGPGINHQAEPFVPRQEARRGVQFPDEYPAPEPDQ
jgi:hypothetical protein